jgi:hypothetical protein
MSTQEEIIQRINERLTIDANLLEGGFSQDIIGSVAYELANIKDVDLNVIVVQILFTHWSTRAVARLEAAGHGHHH